MSLFNQQLKASLRHATASINLHVAQRDEMTAEDAWVDAMTVHGAGAPVVDRARIAFDEARARRATCARDLDDAAESLSACMAALHMEARR